jgi:IS5 family transposase
MQVGLFDLSDSYARLDKRGDPLLKLSEMINLEELRPKLAKISYESTAKGGRPSLDPLMMIKILILQSLYNIADESCEYQINDRLSFKRFLGLSMSQKAPDATSIWNYRERIKDANLHDEIFDWFSQAIDNAGYSAEDGQIIDASFVPTHKPTGKHKKQIEEGEPLTKKQAEQIDNDATFTKKNSETHHGYKNHIQIDNKHKIIRKQTVTTASTHDSQEFQNLIDAGDPESEIKEKIYADSAYRSAKSEEMLVEKSLISQVHERAYRNNPLTDEQKKSNTEKSHIRARVEHVFGHMTTSMGGQMIHTIGSSRAKIKITFKNLAYNMWRFAFLKNRNLEEQSV